MAAQKVPLVWANLFHNKVRTLVGIAGITFAVLLIFMQLGFLGSSTANATLIYNRLEFDLVLLSADYVEFSQPGWFSRSRLAQVRALPDVAKASPLYCTFQFCEDRGEPAWSDKLHKRRLFVLAFSPNDPVFNLLEVQKHEDLLKMPGKILFDSRSRRDFDVSDEKPETLTKLTYWLGTVPVHVVGQFSLGSGFFADGMVLVGTSTFARLQGPQALDAVQYGLIKLKDHADHNSVAQELNSTLGPDVHVWTRAAIEAREKDYWVYGTSLGIIFICGVVVAVLVGIVFVYQVISSDIGSRLKEFATLKAMGYSDRYLAMTILEQAVLLAVFGYIPGLVIAFILYGVATLSAGIPIGISGESPVVLLLRCLFVLGITVGLCSLSGLFALGKLKSADPADLF